MKKDLSPQAIWGIVAGIILLGVLALGYYFYMVMAKEEPVSPVRSNYNVSVITEMRQSPNIFEKMIPLNDVPQSYDQNTQYQPANLGKTDLSKYE